MNDVAALAKIRCPVVAFGIGYNCILEVPRNEMARTLTTETLEKLKGLASSSSLIASRDRKLVEVLATVSDKPVSVIGDPALLLEADSSASDIGRTNDGRLHVGLNFALHGPISAGIFCNRFEDYVKFLKRLQKTRPVTFWYFAHCDTERIAVALLRERGIQTRSVDLTPRGMIAAYGRMDFVICQMLHASILATNAGVPSMNIGYDVKNISFYELMNLPELCVPHDAIGLESLLSTFQSMVGRRNEIVAVLEQRKADLAAATGAFASDVAVLARGHAGSMQP
jgi:polysaccharide pyruvyl transferase WcaK-like protein